MPLLICAIAAALRTRCGALVFFRIPERDLFLGCEGRLAIELAIWLAADVLDAASAGVGASSIASSSSWEAKDTTDPISEGPGLITGSSGKYGWLITFSFSIATLSISFFPNLQLRSHAGWGPLHRAHVFLPLGVGHSLVGCSSAQCPHFSLLRQLRVVWPYS